MVIFLYKNEYLINVYKDLKQFEEDMIKWIVLVSNYMIKNLFIDAYNLDDVDNLYMNYEYDEDITKYELTAENLEILSFKYPWFLRLDNILSRLNNITNYKHFQKEFKIEVYNYIKNDSWESKKAIDWYKKVYFELNKDDYYYNNYRTRYYYHENDLQLDIQKDISLEQYVDFHKNKCSLIDIY